MSQDSRYRLCELASLADGACRGFSVELQGQPLDLLLARLGQEVFGYVNSCPHTGATLNWLPDQFLDTEGTLIQCATHGALFRREDGYCVHGPCAGESLRPVALEIRDGWIAMAAGGRDSGRARRW